MKLLYTAYEICMALQENCAHHLCIEHPKAYAEIIHHLYRQCDGGEGDAILSDGTKSLSLAKNAVMILEPFSLQFDTRKINTALYNEATVRKYVREQEMHDQAVDKLSVKEYEDPFAR